MPPTLARVLLALTPVIGVAGVWWATLHGPSEAGRAPLPAPVERATPAAVPVPAMPAEEAAQPLPQIRVRATLLSQQGQPRALLEIGHAAAKWYRIGDTVQPGFIITAIDRTQVTVRDDPHNAHYEIPIHNVAD